MKPLNPKYYNQVELFNKIKSIAKSVGVVVIYPVLVLFYLFKDKEVPANSKTIIAAALAYFIFPIDSIPDMTPFIGYSDDLGVLYVSISQLTRYITPDILNKVKQKIVEIFGETVEIEKQEQKVLNKINEKKADSI